MKSRYIRYIYPSDCERARAGLVGHRLRSALIDRGLATKSTKEDVRSIVLVPAGDLERFSVAAGLVDPEVQITLYGRPRVFSNPYATTLGDEITWCPRCDTASPTCGHLLVGPQGEVGNIPLATCPACAEPYDPDMWPRSAEPVAFTAQLVIALIARRYRDTRPSFASHCPALLHAAQSVLREPLDETLVASDGGRNQRWVTTIRGARPLENSRTQSDAPRERPRSRRHASSWRRKASIDH